VAHGADRALKFIGVHCGNLPIVIKVVKRFVDAIKILEVGKDEELALSKPFSLVNGKWSNIVFIAGLSKATECKQQNRGRTRNHWESAMFSHFQSFLRKWKATMWDWGLVTGVLSNRPEVGYAQKNKYIV
jgi:hypothetical protein